MAASEHICRRTLLDLPRFIELARYYADAVPSIASPDHSGSIAGLAIFSGLLSTVATWQVNHPYVFYLGPGIFFGLLVLLPWCRACGISWWQTLLTVCLSPVGYAAAVGLVLSQTGYTLAAGLAGCAITFAPLFVGTHPRIRASLIRAMFVGGLVGIPISFLCLAMVGGVAVWQVAVAWCLCAAFDSGERQ